MSRIEDEELRSIFADEAREHLLGLEEDLARIERDAQDSEGLTSAQRRIHTLKGAARMLGLPGLERIAHRAEDMMESATTTGRIGATSVAWLYQAVDAMRELAREATEGIAATVDVDALVEGRAPDAATRSGDVPALSSGGETTLRVASERLDVLLRSAGQLRVTALRSGKRDREFGDAALAVDGSRKALRRLQSDLHAASVPSVIRSKLMERAIELETQLAGLESTIALVAMENRNDATRLLQVSDDVHHHVQRMRLVPFSATLRAFPRMVRDIAAQEGKQVELMLEGTETLADKAVVEGMSDPLVHLVRNAIHHGIETPEERQAAGKPPMGRIVIRASRVSDRILIEVEDDGRGIDVGRVKARAIERRLITSEEAGKMDDAAARRLVFRTGLSTAAAVSDISGRGVGLDIVLKAVERLKGDIAIASGSVGAAFKITAHITLATAHVIIVREGGAPFAIPIDAIERIRPVRQRDVFHVEGRASVRLDGRTLPVERLSTLLEVPGARIDADTLRPCVVLNVGGERIGIMVEQAVEEDEIVLQAFSGTLRRVRGATGATILGSGEVCLVLGTADLVQGVGRTGRAEAMPMPARKRTKRVLIVEDSLTTRVQLRRILESAGYAVALAVDGVDALEKIASETPDAIVTDVQMPRMDGFELTTRLRADAATADVPIIIVTSLSDDEEKRRGVAAGANAYMTKGTFDHTHLLDTLRRLL